GAEAGGPNRALRDVADGIPVVDDEYQAVAAERRRHAIAPAAAGVGTDVVAALCAIASISASASLGASRSFFVRNEALNSRSMTLSSEVNVFELHTSTGSEAVEGVSRSMASTV